MADETLVAVFHDVTFDFLATKWVGAVKDYELLVTVQDDSFDAIAEALYRATGTTLTAIGRITDGNELRWLDGGKPTEIDIEGFKHF
mgnify:CR=1 FL=1